VDGVKAVSRRRRGRASASLEPGHSPVYFNTVAPRWPGFLATVVGGDRSANLTPASGRQDHTTSPSAICAAAASTASRPYVRDDRDTPLMWDGMRELWIW